MGQLISMTSARDFQSAFRVEPEIVREAQQPASVGIYRWSTPRMDGFELPRCDDLVVAMHVGGSRRVRALTEGGPSRSRSAPGRLTILPAGRSAAFRTEGSVRLVSLHVARNALAADWPQTPRFAFQDAFARAAMEALLHAACAGQAAQSEYIAKVSSALLYHLAQSAPAPAVHNPVREGGPLAALLAQVDANLGDRLDLDDLAARARLSRATLVRRFREATGLAPHQYLMLRRIEAAKVLLRDSAHELCSIAQEIGFSSQSHFTAEFRRATGLTPGQFRRSH